MKRLLFFACLFAAALALKGDDAPTLDVFAGWGWSPFRYDRYPYGYGPYRNAYYPYTGLGLPLYRGDSFGAPYGYYGDEPFWGYDYGVRIQLKDKRYAPALSEGLLQPLPGSAPTELRDPKRERLWQSDLETLYGTRSGARQPSPTNAAPQLLTPNF
jgi:hypothetical protein